MSEDFDGQAQLTLGKSRLQDTPDEGKVLRMRGYDLVKHQDISGTASLTPIVFDVKGKINALTPGGESGPKVVFVGQTLDESRYKFEKGGGDFDERLRTVKAFLDKQVPVWLQNVVIPKYIQSFFEKDNHEFAVALPSEISSIAGGFAPSFLPRCPGQVETIDSRDRFASIVAEYFLAITNKVLDSCGIKEMILPLSDGTVNFSQLRSKALVGDSAHDYLGFEGVRIVDNSSKNLPMSPES